MPYIKSNQGPNDMAGHQGQLPQTVGVVTSATATSMIVWLQQQSYPNYAYNYNIWEDVDLFQGLSY